MEKILITGANGFLAKSTIPLLGGDGELVALVGPGTVLPGKPFSKSYSDHDALFRNEKRFSHVFHFAAHIPYGAMNIPDKKLTDINVSFTTLLTQSYPQARFVFASSVSVYGKPRELPVRIDSALAEPDMYGKSKLAGEAAIRNLASQSIIRFTSLIGVGMKKVSFIPIIIEQALKTGAIILFGDGGRGQNYMDVRDAAALCVACARTEKNILTLGVSDRSYSNNEIAAMIAARTGARIVYQGEDHNGSMRYDTGHAFADLNFRPAYTMEQTLSEMISE